ncbi:RNA-directed DNA polymerase from mobile element jockey [Trichonephila clavipes]|nr:RNA-directed DNA polymerase from mobile element jockey [Trichonephila clavipes]
MFIHSFLSNRSFRVRVNKTLSSPRPIRSGLPQGSLSSSLLFTLYVNDVPQTDLSHLAMFADDTAIITQNKRFSVVISNLQHYISLLELWLTDWKVKVNASKSACLMFTRRPRLPVGLTPSNFWPTRPLGTCCKVPRVIFRRKINFCPPHRTDSQKAQTVHAVLKRLISRRSKLAIRHKVLLYKSIIRPVMSYGSHKSGDPLACAI